MGHITMEAACHCEIVADDTPALDANCGFTTHDRTPILTRSSAGSKAVRLTRLLKGCMYVQGRVHSVYILFSFMNLCMFWFVSWQDFIGESSRLTCTRRIFMLREILVGFLPAHPARMWVWESVTGHYKEEGVWESRTLRLLLYGETVLLRSHEIIVFI